MSVLIKGMEMPTDGNETIIRIQTDGTVLDQYGHHLVITAVPVPKHGRLGDLDALHKLFLDKGKEYKGVGGAMLGAAAWCIANAPTIIPADKEGEG